MIRLSRLINTPSWFPIGQPGELSPNPGTRYHSFLGILLHPYSKGSVHIKSADPLAQPAIDPNYLSEAGKSFTSCTETNYIANNVYSGC